MRGQSTHTPAHPLLSGYGRRLREPRTCAKEPTAGRLTPRADCGRLADKGRSSDTPRSCEKQLEQGQFVRPASESRSVRPGQAAQARCVSRGAEAGSRGGDIAGARALAHWGPIRMPYAGMFRSLAPPEVLPDLRQASLSLSLSFNTAPPTRPSFTFLLLLSSCHRECERAWQVRACLKVAGSVGTAAAFGGVAIQLHQAKRGHLRPLSPKPHTPPATSAKEADEEEAPGRSSGKHSCAANTRVRRNRNSTYIWAVYARRPKTEGIRV